jgi:hypothetical protein
MPTSRKIEPHGTGPQSPEGFTGAELLAAFSAVVAGGKSAQEAVKLIAPLIRGKVARRACRSSRCPSSYRRARSATSGAV